jgi:LDH2 family malate/lactate/ureidoglycolate dehydrogenase
MRALRTRDGIPIPEDTWAAVTAAAAGVGLDLRTVLP